MKKYDLEFFFRLPGWFPGWLKQGQLIRWTWSWPPWEPYAQWWWEKQLGGGYPRWLRQTWCLVFHWRHFRHLGGTDCGTLHPFVNFDGKLVVIHAIEHLDHAGCGACQFVWWTKQRIEIKTEIEEAGDGGQERDPVDGGNLESPGRM